MGNDQIVAINGVQGKPKLLKKELKNSGLLLARGQASSLLLRRPKRRQITLVKTRGKALGLDIAQDVYLPMVRKVTRGSLCSDWNAQHPNDQILEGDVIGEVNGVKRDRAEVLSACKEEAS